MAKGGAVDAVGGAIARLIARRDELLRDETAIQVAAIDAELAAIQDAETARLDAERRARLAVARDARDAVELRVGLAVRELGALFSELAECERAVGDNLPAGRSIDARSARVPGFLRNAVRRAPLVWQNWYPEMAGLPPRAEPAAVDAVAAARARVTECERMCRELSESSSGWQHWRDSLKDARRRLAELTGAPVPSDDSGADAAWLGRFRGDG